MSRVPRPFLSSAADAMRDFLRYNRALGQRFDTEELALKLFDQYLGSHEIPSLAAITPALVNDFVCSRRRPVAKSHNHLVGVLRRWFNWLVGQERLRVSPLQLTPRPQTATCSPFLFDKLQAQRLLAVAERLKDNNRGHQRGIIYSMIFALLYGLGLRVGEVASARAALYSAHVPRGLDPRREKENSYVRRPCADREADRRWRRRGGRRRSVRW